MYIPNFSALRWRYRCVRALGLALGLALLDELLLLPHAASSATMAIANRAAIDHRARRRVDLRDAR